MDSIGRKLQQVTWVKRFIEYNNVVRELVLYLFHTIVRERCDDEDLNVGVDLSNLGCGL